MTNDNSRNPRHQLRAPASTQNPQEDHIPHVAPPQPLRLRGPDVERGTAAADPDQTPHDVPAPLLLSDSNKGRCLKKHTHKSPTCTRDTTCSPPQSCKTTPPPTMPRSSPRHHQPHPPSSPRRRNQRRGIETATSFKTTTSACQCCKNHRKRTSPRRARSSFRRARSRRSTLRAFGKRAHIWRAPSISDLVTRGRARLVAHDPRDARRRAGEPRPQKVRSGVAATPRLAT